MNLGQIGQSSPLCPVLESILIIGKAIAAVEYLTTCARPIVAPAVFDTIGRLIKGAPLYTLQICRTIDVLKTVYFRKHPDQFDRNQIEEIKAVVEKWVRRIVHFSIDLPVAKS